MNVAFFGGASAPGRRQNQKKGECWVDLFEQPCFMGRLRRIWGPVTLPRLTAASLIVGPEARAVVTLSDGKSMRIAPRRVIPYAARTIGSQTFTALSIEKS